MAGLELEVKSARFSVLLHGLLSPSFLNTHPRMGFLLRECQLELQYFSVIDFNKFSSPITATLRPWVWVGWHHFLSPWVIQNYESFIAPGHLIGGHVTRLVQEEAMSSSPVFSEKLLVAVARGWLVSRIFCAYLSREKASLRIKLTQKKSKLRTGESFLMISFKHQAPAKPAVRLTSQFVSYWSDVIPFSPWLSPSPLVLVLLSESTKNKSNSLEKTLHKPKTIRKKVHQFPLPCYHLYSCGRVALIHKVHCQISWHPHRKQVIQTFFFAF